MDLKDLNKLKVKFELARYKKGNRWKWFITWKAKRSDFQTVDWFSAEADTVEEALQEMMAKK